MKRTQIVAYLGPQGTFSQAAALCHFTSAKELRAFASIDEVFLAVENGSVDCGVVPVENSTEGAVNNTQDCLIDSTVQIVGEEVIPISQSLLLAPSARPENLSAIASHKQSLAQCRRWLQANYPGIRQIECASNAAAAKMALADDTVAAIAGELCAEIYGLSVHESAIQDQQHNRTRFLVLAQAQAAPTGNDKTSVLLYTENKPGALFRVLEPFENLQVSLSKIETRPSKKEAWEYVFFVDFEGHTEDARIRELFSRLERCTAEIKVLGSYPSATIAMAGKQ